MPSTPIDPIDMALSCHFAHTHVGNQQHAAVIMAQFSGRPVSLRHRDASREDALQCTCHLELLSVQVHIVRTLSLPLQYLRKGHDRFWNAGALTGCRFLPAV